MVQEDPLCDRCSDSCYGDIVNVEGKYYHQYCFSCIKCKKDLLKNGYFFIDGEFYCNEDYYKLMGTQCGGCGKYVEGEVVSALDTVYHPDCFGCGKCRKIFPPGMKITFDGDIFLCEDCNKSIEEHKRAQQKEVNGEKAIITKTSKNSDTSASNCAGCGNDIKSGQALLALEKQWHLWCFTCNKCGCLLAGEYMGRDGVPYCEQDYQTEFGVSCAGCGGYITGKVLQAGEKHYHPQCSRCAKCGQMFGEGEEMYLQGSEIWHPQCSEEYQKENKEADNQWLAENEFQHNRHDDEPVTTSSPRSPRSRVQTKFSNSDDSKPAFNGTTLYSFNGNVEPERKSQPYQNDDNNNLDEKTFNNYNNHGRQSLHSSEGSGDDKSSIWQPPSYQAATSKPAGFRSVKPPQISASVSVKPAQNKTLSRSIDDEEDAPPPVPPPPTRTSSNAFKEKYASGVYSATPFQKQEPAKTRPLSYIESAAARNTSIEKSPTVTSRTTISINTRSTSSTSSNNDEKDGPGVKVYKKGAGVNKLQARKSMNLQNPKQNGFGPPVDIDHEVQRKLKEDVYLSDREFYQAFQMTREKYYALPKWKQDDLKKKAMLF
ncbi:actin-binding LIM protein 2-like isoform X2 [Hydractinia symbiolongicarpus]|uniref:actin-binding LIM protein 2-like isoform X2 n=1 Tax=Hydractinia symbiolongicarpus TaxID=13093 RepID=UPI002551C368|nr:actin-binding LIM protein 2-like isoform X2 [Hydractinia symbiolongicarpus]